MGISVVLIDKSEIVEKMLSHCLYYFSAKVLRIENWDENREKIKEIKTDIFFVEWEIKKDGKALALSLAEEVKPCPVVLLYRSSSAAEINSLSSNHLPHRLVKPFDPKILREVFTQLVPQVKESKIHPFLKFPKGKAYQTVGGSKENIKIPFSSKQTMDKSPLQGPTTQKTMDKASPQGSITQKIMDKSPLQSPTTQKIMNKASPQGPTTQKTMDKSPLQSPTTQKIMNKASPQGPTTQKTMDKSPLQDPTTITPAQQTKSREESQPSINSMLKESISTQTLSPIEEKKEQTSTSFQKEILEKSENVKRPKEIKLKTSSQKNVLTKKQFKSETEEIKEFNIDENTKNDLAPMAIKSSSSEKESALKSENIELNEKDILKVLNKYKDSLEFQQLMEKVFSENAATVVTKILQNGNLEGIVENSLTQFKDSQSFKSFVELEIKKSLKKQLPLTLKSVVEEEIKKIIGD